MAASLLFLYGSLMRGERSHGRLCGATFVGRARTAPAYELVDLGPYPGLVEGGSTSVAGELYEVDGSLLGSLDEFEGVPELYRRVEVRLDDGRSAEAYVLVARPADGRVIPGGDWRAR